CHGHKRQLQSQQRLQRLIRSASELTWVISKKGVVLSGHTSRVPVDLRLGAADNAFVTLV
ncbi:MAG: hypothetical protein QNK98_04900, partial [Yoonia sp.]